MHFRKHIFATSEDEINSIDSGNETRSLESPRSYQNRVLPNRACSWPLPFLETDFEWTSSAIRNESGSCSARGPLARITSTFCPAQRRIISSHYNPRPPSKSSGSRLRSRSYTPIHECISSAFYSFFRASRIPETVDRSHSA